MYDFERLPLVARGLNTFESYCCITVALKIADHSCKMDEYEKNLFMALFKSLPSQTVEFFNDDIFDIILTALNNPSAKAYSEVKKLREAAMDMITKPKMKAFKASIREQVS